MIENMFLRKLFVITLMSHSRNLALNLENLYYT